MSFRVAPAFCPYCKYGFDQSSNIRDGRRKPRPGNYTLCISCGGVLVYDAELRARAPTTAETLELEGRPELRRWIATAQSVIRSRTEPLPSQARSALEKITRAVDQGGK